MLIDSYEAHWQDRLCEQQAALTAGRQLFLLIDGAFMPDFFRAVERALPDTGKVTLLFEDVPGCTDDVRAVSPFLVPYSVALTRALNACSGWPMLGAIETTETIAALGKRLSAWCIVKNGDQRFNFRFPDTRRLPAIFAILSDSQRSTMTGPACGWSYIGRNGAWAELATPGSTCSIALNPSLDDRQFAIMVGDSEADETIVLLQDRGPLPQKLPSEIHALVQAALRVASLARLDKDLLLNWCRHCLNSAAPATEIAARAYAIVNQIGE